MFWTGTAHTESVAESDVQVVDRKDRAIAIMDMGQHYFTRWHEPLKLTQVLVPGLEERARFTPTLDTDHQILPGYFDAPGALDAPLRMLCTLQPPLPDVTLVFCCIEKLKEMKETAPDAAASGLLIYLACVRKLLRRFNGYECQEADGNFMLAFKDPVSAICFCLMVQEEMVREVWSEEVLQLGPCKGMQGPNNEVIFSGPRVKMGVYEGRPNRICPHTTTGRADYFGPFVNRAARFCNAAAHGGQIMAPSKVVEKLILAWTGQACPPPEVLEPIPTTSEDDAHCSQEGFKSPRQSWEVIFSRSSTPKIVLGELITAGNSAISGLATAGSVAASDANVPGLNQSLRRHVSVAEEPLMAVKSRRASRVTSDIPRLRADKSLSSNLKSWMHAIAIKGKALTESKGGKPPSEDSSDSIEAGSAAHVEDNQGQAQITDNDSGGAPATTESSVKECNMQTDYEPADNDSGMELRKEDAVDMMVMHGVANEEHHKQQIKSPSTAVEGGGYTAISGALGNAVEAQGEESSASPLKSKSIEIGVVEAAENPEVSAPEWRVNYPPLTADKGGRAPVAAGAPSIAEGNQESASHSRADATAADVVIELGRQPVESASGMQREEGCPLPAREGGGSAVVSDASSNMVEGQGSPLDCAESRLVAFGVVEPSGSAADERKDEDCPLIAAERQGNPVATNAACMSGGYQNCTEDAAPVNAHTLSDKPGISEPDEQRSDGHPLTKSEGGRTSVHADALSSAADDHQGDVDCPGIKPDIDAPDTVLDAGGNESGREPTGQPSESRISSGQSSSGSSHSSKKLHGLAQAHIVEFHHRGTYTLKGVSDSHAIFQINSALFANRVFPKKAASNKAELVVPGKGLVYKVVMKASDTAAVIQ